MEYRSDRTRSDAAADAAYREIVGGGDYDPEQDDPPDSVKLAEWPVLSRNVRHAREQIDKLKAAVAPYRDLPHPLGQRSTESTIDFACRLITDRIPKDDPPADVLGEAFRMWMDRADADKRVSASIYRAVDELAKVVERIARAQKQEDR